MQIRVKRITTKELEVGSFYLCDKARADFSSINIYVGKDYKNYFIFYNVLNIRVSDGENVGLRLNLNKEVNLGTDNMMKMYSEVIKETLSGPVISEHIRNVSGITGIYNKIDFGFTAKNFVEDNLSLFGLGEKLKRVTEKSLNTTDIYISSDMKELYHFLGKDEIDIGSRLLFDVTSYWNNSFHTYRANMMNLCKMYKVKDVLNNKYANNEFRRKSSKLYEYIKDGI